MRTTMWVAFIAAITLAIAPGCNNGQPSTSGKFRVAMILPGKENDEGWNQSAKEGLDRIKADLGADTKLVTNVSQSEMARQVTYFASNGYDVVICHGYEFQDIVPDIAAKYPKVHFIVGGSPREVPGAISVEFLARDASYLVGIVAAEVSKTRKAAFVGAQPVPTVQACADGMRDGLKAAKRSDVEMLQPLWTNSWDSPVAAREKADLAIGAGADVIYQNVDAAATGVFQAVQAANRGGKTVWAFGCNRNQNDKASDVILGSVVIDVPLAYLNLTREAKDGTWKNRAARLGLQGGYVDLVLNAKNPAITDAICGKVDAARQKLLAATTRP